MSHLPPKDRLGHILAEAEFLLKIGQEIQREGFLTDETRQRACVRSLEIIGEATKRLDEAFRARYPNVEWRLMARTRDRVIHDYAGVDYDIVWEIIETEIPSLAEKIRAILGEL